MTKRSTIGKRDNSQRASVASARRARELCDHAQVLRSALALLALILTAGTAAARTVTDDSGRAVTVPVPPLPALHRAATLRTLPAGSDEQFALLIRLTRERNKIVHAISTATEAFEHALTAAEGPGRPAGT